MKTNLQNEVLTKEEERALFAEMHAGDNEARNTLITRNVRLAYKLAQPFANRGVDMDDLKSSATIGLIKAVDNYQLDDRDARFATYARFIIEEEIRLCIEETKTIRIPDHIIRANTKIARAKEEYFREYECEPDYEDISEWLDGEYTPNQIREYQAANKATMSLDYQYGDGEDTCTLLDTISYNEEETNHDALTKIEELISMYKYLLKEREIFILEKALEGNSFSATGEMLGISKQAVQQAYNKAVAKLKSAVESADF